MGRAGLETKNDRSAIGVELMSNVGRAREILRSLARQGMSEVVVCAGARNAPLVALLDKVRGIKVHSFFEERSAGFFAIGRMRATGRPVGVCTTSGTAVAELLPAVIEAQYQSLPLLVLSADRPVSYRGTGAPQTIVQPGIFSSYVEKCWDVGPGPLDVEIKLSGEQPAHINVCFAEPLVDEAVGDWELWPENVVREPSHGTSVTIAAQKPLVIVSGLSKLEADSILPVLTSWGRPVYAEATSQLRGRPELADIEVLGGEPFSHLDFDGVIRIGNVPTLRLWRDLESNRQPVWNFSRQMWSGLPREKQVLPLSSLMKVTANFTPWKQDERIVDRKRGEILHQLCAEFPRSEPSWIARLSRWIPENSLVFLGNSLPIREWDLCAGGGAGHRIEGNRGVNGIDGLVSTFIGLAGRENSNWAVIGDLSALYDLSGPWAARAGEFKDLNLVVINNGGGKIFERMFKTPLFENRHSIEFSGWAKMWGWDYIKLDKPEQSLPPSARPRMIEIIPDAEHTTGFYDNWEKQR